MNDASPFVNPGSSADPVAGRHLPARQPRRRFADSSTDRRSRSADESAACRDELQRIAHELHDDMGQRLFSIKLRLASCLPSAPPDVPQEMTDLVAMVDEAAAALARIAARLQPERVAALGLSAGLRALVAELAPSFGLAAHLDIQGGIEEIASDEQASALYRAVQEALVNIKRHSISSSVHIRLRHRRDRLRLVVRNDGHSGAKPGSPARESHGAGLNGLHARVRTLGGHLHHGARPDGGYLVSVWMPATRRLVLPDLDPVRAPDATD